MDIISEKAYDSERALYGIKDTNITSCVFAGKADGESALKECSNIEVNKCRFSLRYPMWHVNGFLMCDTVIEDSARAPIWYSNDGRIEGCTVKGVKCMRECDRIEIVHSDIESPEFCWKSRDVRVTDTGITSEYMFFESRNIVAENIKVNGKYSFQYTENVSVTDSEFNTKDSFWHAKNTVVKNSILNGEYLGWYSDGLTLINCCISGTQPLCYCKNLKVIDCTMDGTDLSFEYSDVEAAVNGNIVSVKNPLSGVIVADSIGQVIFENSVMECNCVIVDKSK